MSVQSHIGELEARHRKLDEEIDREGRMPARDDLRLTEMKRRRLHLKERIERLKARSH